MARKRKQKPWDALGISQRTYYRRQAKHDQQPPQPLDFDRAGFLQDQLKETNKAATEVIYGDNPTHKLTAINPLSHGSSNLSHGGTITLKFDDDPKSGEALSSDGRRWKVETGTHDPDMVEVELTQQDFNEAAAAQAAKLRDAADTALVEQFLWEVERFGGTLPCNWVISGRMAQALYNALKAGKGE